MCYVAIACKGMLPFVWSVMRNGFLPLYPQSPLRFMSGTTPMRSVTCQPAYSRITKMDLQISNSHIAAKQTASKCLCRNAAKATPFPHLRTRSFPSVSRRHKVSRSAALFRSISAIELRFLSPWFSYWFMALQDQHNQPVISHEGSEEP